MIRRNIVHANSAQSFSFFVLFVHRLVKNMRLGARFSVNGSYIVLECGCMSVTVELLPVFRLSIGFMAYLFSLFNENHVLFSSHFRLS